MQTMDYEAFAGKMPDACFENIQYGRPATLKLPAPLQRDCRMLSDAQRRQSQRMEQIRAQLPTAAPP
jgi:hypothetical protein